MLQLVYNDFQSCWHSSTGFNCPDSSLAFLDHFIKPYLILCMMPRSEGSNTIILVIKVIRNQILASLISYILPKVPVSLFQMMS